MLESRILAKKAFCLLMPLLLLVCMGCKFREGMDSTTCKLSGLKAVELILILGTTGGGEEA
jgi:hypothetical protein